MNFFLKIFQNCCFFFEKCCNEDEKSNKDRTGPSKRAMDDKKEIREVIPREGEEDEKSGAKNHDNNGKSDPKKTIKRFYSYFLIL